MERTDEVHAQFRFPPGYAIIQFAREDEVAATGRMPQLPSSQGPVEQHF